MGQCLKGWGAARIFSRLARSPGRVRVLTCHPAKAIWRLGPRPMYAPARTTPRLPPHPSKISPAAKIPYLLHLLLLEEDKVPPVQHYRRKQIRQGASVPVLPPYRR